MLQRVLRKLRSGEAAALISVYLRQGRLYVQANDRTFWRTAGFWVAAGPVECIPASDSELIGRAVLAALRRSRVEVPIPSNLKALEAELFTAMGVRSRRASMQGTRYCTVRREQSQLTFQPYRNGGPSGETRGYSPLGASESLKLPADSTPDLVGDAVLTVLERASA